MPFNRYSGPFELPAQSCDLDIQLFERHAKNAISARFNHAAAHIGLYIIQCISAGGHYNHILTHVTSHDKDDGAGAVCHPNSDQR